MLAKMAWRNLWRNKRRTMITLSSIAFGLFLSSHFFAIGDDNFSRMIDSAAKLGAGHVTVEPLDYRNTPSLDKTITQTDEILEMARNFPGINHAARRITGQAMFATAGNSIGGAFMAIDPATENIDSFLLIDKIVEGEMFDSADAKGIIIGRKMADKLDLRLGKKLVYTMTNKDGEITSSLARVKGIYKTGIDGLDGFFGLFTLGSMQKVLGYQPDEVSQVAILIDDNRDSTKIANALIKQLGRSNIFITTWHKTQQELAGAIAMKKSGNYMFQVIMMILIMAGILNTLLMSVMERMREFGVLVAIGLSPGRLFGMVLWEAFWLALLGLLVGVLLTSPSAYYLHTTGWDIAPYMTQDFDMGGVIWEPIIYFNMYLNHALFLVGLIFTITILSGLYPAWKAGRVIPVEAIKTI